MVADEKVLILKSIRVTYRLRAAAEHRETIERVHGMHARHCPVARSLEGGIEIETRLEIEPE